MDREQLYRNLSELESQLRGVKSSTEQVKAVLQADGRLVEAVNGYSQKLSTFLDEARASYGDDVKGLKTLAVDSLEKSVSDFNARTEPVIGALKADATALGSLVDGTLRPLVEGDMANLVNGDLRTLVHQDMPSMFSRSIEEHRTRIDSSLAVLKEASEDFAASAQGMLADCRRCLEENRAVIGQLEGKVTSLQASADEVKGQSTALTDLVKAANDEAIRSFSKIGDDIRSVTNGLRDEMSGRIDSSASLISVAVGSSSEELRACIGAVNESIGSALSAVLSAMEDQKRNWGTIPSIEAKAVRIEGLLKGLQEDVNGLKDELKVQRKRNAFLCIMAVILVIILAVVIYVDHSIWEHCALIWDKCQSISTEVCNTFQKISHVFN